MNTDVSEKVYQAVAKTFRVSTEEIGPETTADDVDGWDSLAHATLLIRLEKAFNVSIGPEGGEAQDLGALINLIEGKIA